MYTLDKLCLHGFLSVSMHSFLSLSPSFFFFFLCPFLPVFTPPPHLSLSLDYFWSAWLISVGSQAQCQGKWSAYKKTNRDIKKLPVFFQHTAWKLSKMSKICLWVCVCVCVFVYFQGLITQKFSSAI